MLDKKKDDGSSEQKPSTLIEMDGPAILFGNDQLSEGISVAYQSNEDVMSDIPNSPGEINVDHFLNQLHSECADDVDKGIDITGKDSSGNSETSPISISSGMFSDEAQLPSQVEDIPMKSDVEDPSIGIHRLKSSFAVSKRKKRSKSTKMRVGKALVHTKRFKPSGVSMKRKKNRNAKNSKFHIMQNYREIVGSQFAEGMADESEEPEDSSSQRQKNQSANEFIIDMVLKLKMEQESLQQQIAKFKGKSLHMVFIQLFEVFWILFRSNFCWSFQSEHIILLPLYYT